MKRVIVYIVSLTLTPALLAQDITFKSHLLLLRTPEANENSRASAVQTPTPAWQTRLSCQETDFIEFVSQDRILVGTINIHDMGGGMNPHEVMLLNSLTGETIWTAPRGDYGSSQALLAYEPVILLQGSKQTAALNPQTGAQIWSRERAGETSLLLTARDLIVFLAQKSSPLSLVALDVKTGKQAWTASVDNYPVDKRDKVELIAMGDTLLLNGAELVAISASEGKLLWREIATSLGPKATAIPLGDQLYFSDRSEVYRADPSSGKVMWHASMARAEFEALTAAERNVLVVGKRTGQDPIGSITALDLNTGKQLWQSDLPDRAASPISTESGILYVTTPRNVIAMKVSDGSVVFNTPIPASLQSNRLLPDNLDLSRNDRVIVARENGVLAVRKSDGKLLFADSVKGGQGFTYEFATARFRHAAFNSLHRNKKHPVELNPESASPDLNFRVAMAQQRSVYNLVSSNQRLAMLNLSSQIHQSFQPRVNSFTGEPIQRTPRQERAAAAHEFEAQAAATVGLTALAIIGERSFERTVGSYQERVRHTFDTHANSLQGKFYVRPSYQQNQGWSLHVVNLETGEHANVLLSSDEDLQPDAMTPNLPAFSTDRSRIVSKGLGSNPEIPEEKKGHSWAPKLRIVTKRPKVSYPSILAFDIASLRFEPASGTENLEGRPVAPAKGTPDEQLLEAVYQDDAEATKKALDAGANINASDEYGDTALMLAAEASTGGTKSKVIKLLLARGADPNVRDPVGLTAREHSELLLSENDYGLRKAGEAIEKAQDNSK